MLILSEFGRFGIGWHMAMLRIGKSARVLQFGIGQCQLSQGENTLTPPMLNLPEFGRFGIKLHTAKMTIPTPRCQICQSLADLVLGSVGLVKVKKPNPPNVKSASVWQICHGAAYGYVNNPCPPMPNLLKFGRFGIGECWLSL